MITIAFALLLLFGCAGTGGGNPPSKPTVLILVPASGSTFVEGETVAVQSVSADPGQVTRVELLIDGQTVTESRPPNPQGEVQFSVVQEWQAAGVGPHVLLVRAFNAAGVSGETSIPIAVNAGVSVEPTATPPVAAPTDTPAVIPSVTSPPAPPTSTPIPAPPTQTTLTVPPTVAPPTPIPPTPIPPSPIPPTPIPPSPIPPTIPPVAFLPPFDGGMSVFVNWDGSEINVEAQANDVAVGNDSGDGIAYVDFFIQDLNGNVIATKRENNSPYCFFGEAEGQCAPSQNGAPNFRWDDNSPIEQQWYFIRAVAHTPDNRIQVAEQPLYVEIVGDGIQRLFVFINEPQFFNNEKELIVEAEVEGESASSGIQRVDFTIVDYDGKVVHKRTEQSARWCGFSGGEGTFPCNKYNFAQNGGRWSNGTPVFPTQYVVRAVAYTNDGNIAASTFFFQIDSIQ
jgi:hypothetical protein